MLRACAGVDISRMSVFEPRLAVGQPRAPSARLSLPDRCRRASSKPWKECASVKQLLSIAPAESQEGGEAAKRQRGGEGGATKAASKSKR